MDPLYDVLITTVGLSDKKEPNEDRPRAVTLGESRFQARENEWLDTVEINIALARRTYPGCVRIIIDVALPSGHERMPELKAVRPVAKSG